MPGKDGAADFVKRGALAARCCGALTPKVVVESVSAGVDKVPVWRRGQSLPSEHNAKFQRLHVPPHMGSPTARRSTIGVGEAADNKPSDAVRAVVVNFILNGRDS